VGSAALGRSGLLTADVLGVRSVEFSQSTVLSFGAMDAASALADLLDRSQQWRPRRRTSQTITAAAVAMLDGRVLASSLTGHQRPESFIRATRGLLRSANRLNDGVEITQVEAYTPVGELLIACDEHRFVAVTTVPRAHVNLAFFDLRNCLNELAESNADDET
jgi:predicted regulator of Ras-like GTPase activity (Roadblock/LC7/MglB family)